MVLCKCALPAWNVPPLVHQPRLFPDNHDCKTNHSHWMYKGRSDVRTSACGRLSLSLKVATCCVLFAILLVCTGCWPFPPPPPEQPTFTYDQPSDQGTAFYVPPTDPELFRQSYKNGDSVSVPHEFSLSRTVSISVTDSKGIVLKFGAVSGIVEASVQAHVDKNVQKTVTLTSQDSIKNDVAPYTTFHVVYGAIVRVTTGHLKETHSLDKETVDIPDYRTLTPITIASCSWSDSNLGVIQNNDACPEYPLSLKPPGILPFDKWQRYGGNWTRLGNQSELSVSDVNDNSGGLEEDKAIISSSNWYAFIFEADIKLLSVGQVGVVFRVTSATSGVDAYTGYYAGVDLNNGVGYLVFGRDSYFWTPLQSPKPITGGILVNQRLHLRVQADACDFNITLQPLDVNPSVPPTGFKVHDSDGCFNRTGAIGLRALVGSAIWGNISARITQ